MTDTSSTVFKSIGAVLGAAVVYIFPTPVLQSFLTCLAVVAVVDILTGIQAAIATKVAVTPQAFIEKAGKKLTRGVSYLALAWISGQLIGSAMPKPGMVSEPIGFVLGALIAADALSVLRNLAVAKNNIAFLDKYFTSIMENFRNQDRRHTPDRRHHDQPLSPKPANSEQP